MLCVVLNFPQWMPIMAERVTLGWGDGAIIIVAIAGLAGLAAAMAGRYLTCAVCGLITGVALLGFDEASPQTYTILLLVGALLAIGVAAFALPRMINDQAPTKQVHVGKAPMFRVWSVDDTVYFATNEPRGHAFNEMTAHVKSGVRFEGVDGRTGLAVYSFRSANPAESTHVLTQYADSALHMHSLPVQRVYNRNGGYRDIVLHGNADAMASDAANGRRYEE